MLAPQKENSWVNLFQEWGTITISGQDAETFLQNQLTCDLREITESKGKLGALCNVKGRVVSTFLIYKKNADFFLHLPRTMITLTLNALRKYSIFSKVKLVDSSHEFPILGVIGSCPQTTQNGIHIIRMPGSFPRFQITGSREAIHSFQEKLNQQTVEYETWKLFDIQEKLPWIYPETSELFLPNMLNLVDLGAISLTKGCFLGQEIIARSHHLGEVKRHLVLGEIDPPLIPPFQRGETRENIPPLKKGETKGNIPPLKKGGLRGDLGDLVVSKSGIKQEIGKVIDACINKEGTVVLLAVVQDAFRNESMIRLNDLTGPLVTLQLCKEP